MFLQAGNGDHPQFRFTIDNKRYINGELIGLLDEFFGAV